MFIYDIINEIMSIVVAKYIFWIMLSLPVLVYGAYLTLKLGREYAAIRNEDARIRKAKKESERRRKLSYEQTDRNRRGERESE